MSITDYKPQVGRAFAHSELTPVLTKNPLIVIKIDVSRLPKLQAMVLHTKMIDAYLRYIPSTSEYDINEWLTKWNKEVDKHNCRLSTDYIIQSLTHYNELEGYIDLLIPGVLLKAFNLPLIELAVKHYVYSYKLIPTKFSISFVDDNNVTWTQEF